MLFVAFGWGCFSVVAKMEALEGFNGIFWDRWTQLGDEHLKFLLFKDGLGNEKDN